MADEKTIDAITARARAVLDARAGAAGVGRGAGASVKTRSASSSSEPSFSAPPPASPRAVAALLARDDGVAGTQTSLGHWNNGSSPVTKLDLVSPRASSGRSPSGSLNKSLAKMMNPSKTIADRWKRFDGEAERLQQEVADLTVSATGGEMQDDDGLDAELEALKARERALIEQAAERGSSEPARTPTPAPDDDGSMAEDDIAAELETLRAQERALLTKVAPEGTAAEPAAGLPAVDGHGTSAAADDHQETENSKCCTSWRAKQNEQPSRKGTSTVSTSVHQVEVDDDNETSGLKIPEYYRWRAPTQHGIVWRAGNFVLAILIGLVLLILLVVVVAASIPTWIINTIIGVIMAYGTHFVVNTLYVSRLGIVREWFIRLCRRCCRTRRDYDEHSRPLRVDVNLPPHNEQDITLGRYCTVHTIALFFDNYAYLIVDRRQGDTKPFPCALVDPADADGVMKELQRLAVEEYGAEPDAPLESTLRVEAILITHKHWDHAWGNRRLTDGKTLKPPLPVLGGDSRARVRVFGGKYDDVDQCTDFLDEGDTACVVGSLEFEILHTPCHTAGSIMFLLRGVEGRDVLFTGDSLFVGGVGAHFEGSAEDSEQNMRKLWLHCKPQTLIFAGHEYSLSILQDRFSSQQIPTGKRQLRQLTAALHRAMTLRARRLPTVPGSLAEEISYNSAFDWLHSSATLLQETWRRFKDVELAREDADDLGDTRIACVVPCPERRSALVPGPRWLHGNGDALEAHSSGNLDDADVYVDVDDESWIGRHAQYLWSLGAQVEESPSSATAVGQQLRRQADQLRANVGSFASLDEAEEALAAEKGDAQQELLQGGGVRFVWGSSSIARKERERIKNADDQRSDSKCRSCCQCFRCLCCCNSSAETTQDDGGGQLTLSEAAQAIYAAAKTCISMVVVTPGAPGATPGASTFARASAGTNFESLRSAVEQLDVACKAMQAIDGAVDQDREDAEDVLRAFVDIGGDEHDGTIAVENLYRGLTELGNEQTTLLAGDVDEIVEICKGDLQRRSNDEQLGTSE